MGCFRSPAVSLEQYNRNDEEMPAFREEKGMGFFMKHILMNLIENVLLSLYLVKMLKVLKRKLNLIDGQRRHL